MKNLFLIAIIVLGFSGVSFGQVKAIATASANIITPISITKDVDMKFGNVAVIATAGTLVLSPTGGRTATGGVTIPATTGIVSAASFTVNGQADYTYAITLPSTHTIKFGALSMIVDGFNTPALKVLTGGSEIILVGATLHVGASQATGLYVSETPFDVTVNYN